MPERPKTTLRSEILLGGVQGFGISLAVWSLASYGASDATATWPLALIAAIAGSLPIRSQRLGPISVALPIVALAQLLAGFPLAMACAVLTGMSKRSPRPSVSSRAAPRRGAECRVRPLKSFIGRWDDPRGRFFPRPRPPRDPP